MNSTTQRNVADRDPTHAALLATMLNTTLDFVAAFLTPIERTQFDSPSQNVQATLRDNINLEVMQYWSSDGVNYNLTRVNIFDPTESDWHFFS
ncbi:hypothetical protein As57867_006580, partial [Aphanomyces stellatus]